MLSRSLSDGALVGGLQVVHVLLAAWLWCKEFVRSFVNYCQLARSLPLQTTLRPRDKQGSTRRRVIPSNISTWAFPKLPRHLAFAITSDQLRSDRVVFDLRLQKVARLVLWCLQLPGTHTVTLFDADGVLVHHLDALAAYLQALCHAQGEELSRGALLVCSNRQVAVECSSGFQIGRVRINILSSQDARQAVVAAVRGECGTLAGRKRLLEDGSALRRALHSKYTLCGTPPRPTDLFECLPHLILTIGGHASANSFPTWLLRSAEIIRLGPPTTLALPAPCAVLRDCTPTDLFRALGTFADTQQRNGT